MLHSHVTAADVALFFAGRLDKPTLRRFLQQALSPCPDCREKLRFYVPPPETDLERHVTLWAEEQAGLARLRRRGGTEPFDGSYSRFKHVARHVPGWARIEHLLELVREMRYRDPGKMWLLAQGAASVATNLGVLPIDKDRYTPAQKAELRARTQIELANAFRLNHNYSCAEDGLGEAADLVDEGCCTPRTKGLLMDIDASLLMDQRRLDEAFHVLDNLHRHYLAYGETHLAGRALISKGIALALDDMPREAAAAFRKGHSLLDPAQDKNLVLSAEFDLLQALTLCGEFHEASQRLMKSGLRHAFADDTLNLLKLRGVEGRIFAGLGKLRRAETILAKAKEGFHQLDRRYLVAMLDLELMSVLLRQGRADEVDALAAEALEIFRDLKVGREAVKAMRFLHEACCQRLATAELVQDVMTFLHRLERQPGLRFLL